MTIKGDDGHTYDVASNGKGNLGVTLGAIGTGLGVLGNHLGLFGLNGNANGCGCNGSGYVTKDELNYVQQLSAKDAEIALLKSEQNTEIKIAEVYDRLLQRINADKAEQAAINTNQCVFNAGVNAAVDVLKSQVACLMNLTKVVIPNTSVCPGWGNVNVTPATTTTT